MLAEINDYQDKMREEMRRHRWLESEKAGRDLGESAEHEWMRKFEKAFRKYWLKNRFSLN